MSQLTREEIVEAYVAMLGPERVLTDEQTLKDNSTDRYYKVETIFGIYSLPLPAAVLKPRSAEEVAQVLRFASEHTVNGCERGGRTNGGTSAPQNDFRVGGAGGYGGFYCFALGAVPYQPGTVSTR